MTNVIMNDHMKYEGIGDTFEVSYGKCKRTPKAWKEECILAAQEIYEKSNSDPIVIQLSGGADSEAVCRFFMEAGIPVEAAIVRFNDSLNIHDLNYVIPFCKENNIKLTMLDLNIQEFMETGMFSYLEKYPRSATVSIPMNMWQIEQLQGAIPVFGSGELFFHRNKYGLYLSEMECRYALFDYGYDNDRKFIWHFFKHTPEQIVSYMQLPYIKNVLQILEVGERFSAHDSPTGGYKNEPYYNIWPAMVKHPSGSGFEYYETIHQYPEHVIDIYKGKKANASFKIYLPEIWNMLT